MAESQEADETEILKAQNFVRDIVQRTLAEQQAAEGKRVEAEPPVTRTDGDRQMRDILDPYFKPDLQQARLESMAAVDESRFYRKHPDAAEYEDKIETIFTESMKRGQPWQREDIHKYLVGKDATENPEKFVEKLTEKKQRQLREAEGAMDFGSNGFGRDRDGSRFKDFKSKTVEEMEKDLEGLTF